MRHRTFCWAVGAALLLAGPHPAGAQEARRITILYDAFGPSPALRKDWGFAALVEYGGRRVLFDTGNSAEIFEHNVRQLGIDLKRLDAAVISHRHGDHTSGLSVLLRQNPAVRIYVPQEPGFFNDGASKPEEGVSMRHEAGALCATFGGAVRYVKFVAWYQEIASTNKNELWCYPDSANGR